MTGATTARPNTGRRATGVLVAVGFAVIILLGGGAAVFYARARLLDVVIGAIAVGAWTIVAWRDPVWRPRTVLWPGLAIVVGVFAVSAITSRNPRWGAEFLGYTVLLAALYALLVTLCRDAIIRARLLATLPILCAAIIVAYLVLVWMDWQRFWQVVGTLAIPPLRPNDQALAYSNPSAAMAVAVLLYASSVACLGFAGRRRGVLIALGIGVAAVMFLTGSRGGLVGVVCGLAGLLVVGLVTRRHALVERLRRDAGLRAGILVVGMGVVVAGIVFWPVLERRLLTGGADLRVSFWLASVRAFLEGPLLGIGPGMWPVDRIRLAVHPESDIYIPHAHNIEINAAAELGVAGLAAGLVVLAFVALVVRDGIRSNDPVRRRWGFVGVFVVCYLLGHQQFDVFANAPAIIAAGAIPIAILDGGFAGRLNFSARVPTAVLLFTGLGVFASTVFLIGSQLHADRYERGIQAANQGTAAAEGLLLETAQADPDIAIHRLAAGLTQARAGDLAAARASFEDAATADDYPISWVNLAGVQERMGDAAGAAASADNAFRLGRQHPNVALAVAEVRRSLGDRDGTVEALTAALLASPSLASDPGLARDAPLAGDLPEALAAALASAGASWQMFVAAGDLDGARRSIEDFHGGEREVIDMYLNAVEDPASNAAAMFTYADANPTFHAAIQLAALLARELQDDDRLAHYRALASTYTQFGPIYGRLARIATDLAVPNFFANEKTTFYGPFTYYRPMPNDDLVPWLPHLIWD